MKFLNYTAALIALLGGCALAGTNSPIQNPPFAIGTPDKGASHSRVLEIGTDFLQANLDNVRPSTGADTSAASEPESWSLLLGAALILVPRLRRKRDRTERHLR